MDWESFEVTTAAPLQASCTIELGPPARAEFCVGALTD